MNILNRLTIKHMLMNKKRTIVTIIGVILSTSLMVGIGLLFSSVRDNSVKMIIQEDGPHHVVIQNMNSDKLSILNNNIKIKHVDYAKVLGYSKLEEESYKRFIELSAVNQEMLGTFTLKEGRMPENENEIVIPSSILYLGDTYKIGNTISLSLGTLTEKEGWEDLEDDWTIDDRFQIDHPVSKSYKIVGVIERNYTTTENADCSFQCLTIDTNQDVDTLSAYITYKKPKDTYQNTETILKNLGNDDVEAKYNSSLLSLSGVSKYNNMISSMIQVIMIILALVSVGCVIVIYNSFAISVMERKKQFGLFSSIGTTKVQLRKTVFFEAVLVGIIGIPLGILGAFLGIGIVIAIINHLLPDAFSVPLALSTYPLFIEIPILFMIVVILISAYLPARRASKITPIEAIRQNDDIKIKSKKIKTRKWVRRLFGIEGELALKNIKRNKRKYRITIVSLFISIVLFISFSGIMYYGISTSIDYTGLPNYDIVATFSDNEDYEKVLSQIQSHDQVDEMVATEVSDYVTHGIRNENYEEKFLEKTGLEITEEDPIAVSIIGLDQKTYDKFRNEIGLKEERPIVINYSKGTYYTKNSRKAVRMKKYKELPDRLPLCLYQTQVNDEEIRESGLVCPKEIGNFYYTESYPMGFDLYITASYGAYDDSLVIIVSENMYKDYNDIFVRNELGIGSSVTRNVLIKASKYDRLDKMLSKLEETEEGGLYNYVNVKEEMKTMNNIVFVIKMLLYGFIALVTLIGVTSVFNTINTSINLRRKEFAMLRSMGLTPKGFNKILYFESIFFGIKSLLYGIPVSLGVVYLLYTAFTGMADQNFVIPWSSIGVAVLGVFLIVFITMWYASSKIKKENILDAIREENI